MQPLETRLLIGGEQVAGAGPAFDVENPYDASVLATLGQASPEQVDAALAAARDAAESASRAKSAFLANTSHEIRTPLNGLLGLARLALRESIEPTVRRQYLEQIFESARGLEGILSDILDFSKIEAGKFTLDDAAFDLHEMLAGVHASYRSLA